MTHNPHPSYTLGENNYSKGSLLLRKKMLYYSGPGAKEDEGKRLRIMNINVCKSKLMKD